MVEDGTYDVIVVDALPLEGTPDGLRLEVTVLSGEHKGQVLGIQAQGLGVDEVAVLGTPGTLTVYDGCPTIVLEP